MIALNIVPLSELERKSGRFKNVPKPAAEELSGFKTICGTLIKSEQNADNERQTEEALTNFFASMFYDRSQLVPNENRMDYVIKSKQDGINKAIIEVKSQQNRNEFISPDNCNKKALWELILWSYPKVCPEFKLGFADKSLLLNCSGVNPFSPFCGLLRL